MAMRKAVSVFAPALANAWLLKRTKAATYTGTYGTHFLVETSATLNNDWATEPDPGPTISFPKAN